MVPNRATHHILGLKLVKLDCIIICLDLDTIKKARNELDGACGLPLVLSILKLHPCCFNGCSLVQLKKQVKNRNK